MTFQRVAKRAHSFGYSFAVIEPVHTEDQLAIRKIGAQLLSSMRNGVGTCSFFKRVEIDPNREMAQTNLAFFETNQLQFGARNNSCIRHHAAYAPEEVTNI